MKELLTRLLKAFNIKQTNKQTNKRIIMQKWKEVQLFTRISLFRMWGEWYYLVSSSRDVYA